MALCYGVPSTFVSPLYRCYWKNCSQQYNHTRVNDSVWLRFRALLVQLSSMFHDALMLGLVYSDTWLYYMASHGHLYHHYIGATGKIACRSITTPQWFCAALLQNLFLFGCLQCFIRLQCWAWCILVHGFIIWHPIGICIGATGEIARRSITAPERFCAASLQNLFAFQSVVFNVSLGFNVGLGARWCMASHITSH